MNAKPTNSWGEHNYVSIEQLKVKGFIGTTKKERSRKQTLLVDVKLYLGESAEAIGDDLRRTVNYDLVARKLQLVLDDSKSRLVETLALAFANKCLTLSNVCAIDIFVRKPKALGRKALPGVRLFKTQPPAS